MYQIRLKKIFSFILNNCELFVELIHSYLVHSTGKLIDRMLKKKIDVTQVVDDPV